MGTAQQAEWAAGVDIARVGAGIAGELVRVQGRQSGRGKRATHDRAQGRVVAHDLVGVLALDHPAIVEVMLEGGERAAGILLPTAPLGAVVVGAFHVDAVAAAIEQRTAAGPARALRVAVLVIEADGEQGVFGQVGFQRAEIHIGVALVVVHERVLVLIRRHRAATHVAAVGQRATHVDLGAIVVPTAGAEFHAGLEVAGGLFADQVDRRARGASAGEQAGSALENFHAVIDRHVGQGLAGRVGGVAQGRNAVVLEVLHREAACVVVIALAVEGRHGDARRMAHHVID
jgi:hypothetical protein